MFHVKNFRKMHGKKETKNVEVIILSDQDFIFTKFLFNHRE